MPCFCSPAHLQALNGWEPFVGEQLAVALYVGLWESPRASLSQPLKSRDYLGPAGHPLKDIPPPAGVGAKGPPQRSCLPSPGPTSPSARKGPLSGETLRHPAPRLRTIPHARQGFGGTPTHLTPLGTPPDCPGPWPSDSPLPCPTHGAVPMAGLIWSGPERRSDLGALRGPG